jgi:hypothetical protein
MLSQLHGDGTARRWRRCDPRATPRAYAARVRLLVIAARMPRAGGKGDQQRTASFLHHLASLHDITLVAPGTERDVELAGLPATIDTRAVAPGGVPRRAGRACAALLRGRPAQVGWLVPSQMRRLVVALARDHDLALFVTCRAWWGPLGVPTVVDHVDAMSLNQRRRARGPEPAAIRVAARLESIALRRHERRITASVTEQIATAEEDAAVLDGKAPVTVIPVAWDGPPVVADPPDMVRDIDMILTGSMRYPPNVAAARRFATDIVPLVRRQLPDATAWVVGRDAARLRLPGVEIASDVPDLHAFLRRAKVALAPLEGATGTPYKVLEAAACGAAVVTTRSIAERFSLPGETATTHAEFADRVVLLLADEQRRRAAVLAGAVTVRQHSGAAMAARLHEVLLRAAAGRDGRS